MRISAIPEYGQIQNIYSYHNSHYNQVQAAAVTPVQKTARVVGVSSQEDQVQLAATYRQENEIDNVSSKRKEELKSSIDRGEELNYNQSNPYEALRMSVDGILVKGMNMDVIA